MSSEVGTYKFANDVYRAVTEKTAHSELEALDQLSAETNTEIPYPLAGLAKRKVNFDSVVDREQMAAAVLDYVG